MRLSRRTPLAGAVALTFALASAVHAQKRSTRPTGPRQAGKPAATATPQEPAPGYTAWDLHRLPMDSSVTVLVRTLGQLGFTSKGVIANGAGFAALFTVAVPAEVAGVVPSNPAIARVLYNMVGVQAMEMIYAANDTITPVNVDTVTSTLVSRLTHALGEPQHTRLDPRESWTWHNHGLEVFMLLVHDTAAPRHGLFIKLDGALARTPWLIEPVWAGHADTVSRIPEPVLRQLATEAPPIGTDSTRWATVMHAPGYDLAIDTAAVTEKYGYRFFWEADFLHRNVRGKSGEYYDRTFSLDLVDCAARRRMTLRNWSATATAVTEEQENWRPFWDSYAEYKGTVAEAACAVTPRAP